MSNKAHVLLTRGAGYIMIINQFVLDAFLNAGLRFGAILTAREDVGEEANALGKDISRNPHDKHYRNAEFIVQ